MKEAKIVAIVVLVILLGIVVIQNRADVETHFLIISVKMPQILLLLLTTAGGFALGMLVALGWRYRKPRV